MLWGKKKEKELPELPVKPSFKEKFFHKKEENEEIGDGNMEIEKHALPSFPDNAAKEGFSQATIKEAVTPEEDDLPPIPEDEPEMEMTERKARFKTVEIEGPMPQPPMTFEPLKANLQSKSTDIFIRIDKFRSARKTLHTIEKNIRDIDELLKKIREIRMREEQELLSWEKEVVNVKSRIKDVAENIFEKTE